MYVRRVTVGWGDMDFNAHMGNTAYLDKSADVRLLFFAENGFPIEQFMKLRIGPVVMKDEVEYFREANLLDELDISLSLAGLAEDGSRFGCGTSLRGWTAACARALPARVGGSVLGNESWLPRQRGS